MTDTLELRSEVIRFVWIDDEPMTVKTLAAAASGPPFEIVVIHPSAPDLSEQIKKSYGTIADLRWKSGARNSVSKKSSWAYPNAKRMLQDLSTRDAQKPVLLISGFFADQENVNIEMEFNPAVKTARLNKGSLRGKTSNKTPGKAAHDEIRRELALLVEQNNNLPLERGIKADPEALHGALDVTASEFSAMSDGERLRLSRAVDLLLGSEVDNIFLNSVAEWIVVCGSPPAVVRWGKGRDTVTDDELDQLASTHGAAPFVFYRPDFVS